MKTNLLGFLILFFIQLGYGQSYHNKTFYIINKNSGKALDVTAWDKKNGANIQQWNLHKGANQQFKLISNFQGYYYIINVNSGKALDVTAWSKENLGNLQQYDLHKGANQQFKLVPAGGGYYYVISRHSGKALDMASWSKNNGANLQQYDLHKGANQQFKFELVEASPGTASVFDQTKWNKVGNIKLASTPALIGMNNALISMAIAETGQIALNSSTQPGKWGNWQTLGPGPQSGFSTHKAVLANKETPPELIMAGNGLYALIRDHQNNLQISRCRNACTNKSSWESWKPLTQDGSIRGRISLTTTTNSLHIVAASDLQKVRYLNVNLSSLNPVDQYEWSDTKEATIGSNGRDELLVLGRTSGDNYFLDQRKLEKSSWESQGGNYAWSNRIIKNAENEVLDISNIEYLGGAYHFVMTIKKCRGEFSKSCTYSIDHKRVLEGKNDDGFIHTVYSYQNNGSTHPKSIIRNYRNKLTVAFSDERNQMHYAFMDSADPSMPWIDYKMEGQTKDRPNIALLNNWNNVRMGGFNSFYASNYGNDLFAMLKGKSDEQAWFVNYSRSFFKKRLHSLYTDVKYCTEYNGDRTMANCNNVTMPPITELAVYSEVGFSTLVLPNWLMTQLFRRIQQGKNEKYITWVHTQFIGAPYIGPNINIDAGMDYFRWWEEGGHTLAGAMGLCDAPNNCENGSKPNKNQMSPLISDQAVSTGFYHIFNQNINSSCFDSPNKNCPSTRLTGFTGYGRNYDATTYQHSFMYPMLYYTTRGEQLRRFIDQDQLSKSDLLKKKYDWVRQHIFKGLEFGDDMLPRF